MSNSKMRSALMAASFSLILVFSVMAGPSLKGVEWNPHSMGGAPAARIAQAATKSVAQGVAHG